MAFKRRANDVDGKTGTRTLAETHLQVEQRRQAELTQQAAVRRFGRYMGSEHMMERGRVEFGERRYRTRANETVQQHRNAVMARGERCSQDRGKLAPAERRCDLQRIAECGAMGGEP